MYRFFIILLYFICFSFLNFKELIAKEIERLDLKTSLELALKYHPLILEKSLQKEIEQSKIEQGKSRFYPRMDSMYGYKKSFLKNQNETPIESKQYFAGIELSQNIYDFGRTSDNVKILKETKEISNLQLEQQKEEVIINTIFHYVNILIQNQNLKVAEENKNYYLKYRDFIKKQIEVGLKTNYELFKVETEYRNAEVEFIKFKNQYELAKLQLLIYLGLKNEEPSKNLNLIQEIQIQEIEPEEIEEIFSKERLNQYQWNTVADLFQIALRHRKDYNIQLKQIQIAQLTRTLNRNDFFPNIGATFQYYWNDQNYTLSSIDRKNWEFNVFIKVPIFEGFLTKSKVEEADLTIQKQQHREEYLKHTIYLELQTLVSELSELKEQFIYYKEALQFAKENLSLSEKRYINGIGTFLELTDATNLYYNARKNYTKAVFEFYLKKVQIYKAIGILMEIL